MFSSKFYRVYLVLLAPNKASRPTQCVNFSYRLHVLRHVSIRIYICLQMLYQCFHNWQDHSVWFTHLVLCAEVLDGVNAWIVNTTFTPRRGVDCSPDSGCESWNCVFVDLSTFNFVFLVFTAHLTKVQTLLQPDRVRQAPKGVRPVPQPQVGN